MKSNKTKITNTFSQIHVHVYIVRSLIGYLLDKVSQSIRFQTLHFVFFLVFAARECGFLFVFVFASVSMYQVNLSTLLWRTDTGNQRMHNHSANCLTDDFHYDNDNNQHEKHYLRFYEWKWCRQRFVIHKSIQRTFSLSQWLSIWYYVLFYRFKVFPLLPNHGLTRLIWIYAFPMCWG